MARPVYNPVFEELETTIENRMLNDISDEWRKEPGDFIYDAVVPVAPEIKALQANQDTVLQNSFAQYAAASFLDYKLAEIGLARIAAVTARRRLHVTAEAGVVIPKGYVVSTVVLDGGGNPVEFTVDTAVTYVTTSENVVDITSKQTGLLGNVPVGSRFIIIPPIPGVQVVADYAVLTPGAAEETDEAAWERYDFKVKHPDTGGNKNDYLRWMKDFEGVGNARILPRWLGNGTVKVVLAGTDAAPATQLVVDSAQNYLDPKLNTTIEAEAMTLSGYGGSVDATQVDDNGNSIKMVYNATGAGVATYGYMGILETTIETENLFTLRTKVKVNSIAGATSLLQITAQDRGTKVPLKQTKGGATDARLTLKANQLAVTFGYVDLPFYWDGLQSIEIEYRRLTTDTTTSVWLDNLSISSPYGQGLGLGKAPGGARVTVVAATPLPINVVATLTLEYGVSPSIVAAAFRQALVDYLKTLVFVANASVMYARVGGLLITTAGVTNYAVLTVNGGTTDILIGTEEVPVVGMVTL